MNYEQNWIVSYCNSVIAALMLLAIAFKPAQAQQIPNLNVINGLFTPTQSERFFREGRQKFERELEIFKHPERYFNDDLLKLDLEPIEERSHLSGNLSWDRKQELRIDRTNYLPPP